MQELAYPLMVQEPLARFFQPLSLLVRVHLLQYHLPPPAKFFQPPKAQPVLANPHLALPKLLHQPKDMDKPLPRLCHRVKVEFMQLHNLVAKQVCFMAFSTTIETEIV